MFSFSDHEFASPVRRRTLAILIGLVFAGFIFRFVQLQLWEGSELRGAASAQGIKRIERVPVRGAIYDRKGRVIAASIPSYTVMLTPQDFNPYRKTSLPLLAKIFGVDTSYIISRLNQAGAYTRFQPVKIWSDASPKIMAQIEEHHEDLPGVFTSYESKRQYVAPIRASHLLGYTKEISENMLEKASESDDSNYYNPGDIVGTSGLEYNHEKDLRGVKGYEYVAVDARGQRQARFKEGKADINAVDGENIQLGLDIDLQVYAEQLLGGAGSGAIVALDPNTGEILALVSKPDFDLDIFSGRTSKAEYQEVMLDKSHPLYNRAMQSAYPPGSTWKLMMAAASLESKTIPFNFTLGCPGYFTYGDHTFNDESKRIAHGAVNVHRSIVASCDVFYYRLSLMLGIDSMYRYAKMFGFDTTSGADIGYEGHGVVPNTRRMNKWYPKGWTKGYTVSHGIGQGEIGVTPMQQAAYAACWANHGVWVQPRAARAVYNSTLGRWEDVKTKSHHIAISDTVIETVRRAMWGAVHEPGGTAHSAETPGAHDCDIAGKTGTAQNPHGKDHAWFVSFAPFDHPKIAMCVLVENAGFGGMISAPITRKLIKYYLFGEREDSLPKILPNTYEYEKYRAMKYQKNQPSTPKPAPDSLNRHSAEATIDEKRHG
ncbi:MAG: penicillin-binding protein 2 [bacterium]